MPQPSYEDVNLILRLYELRREPRMRQAREWFIRDFHPATLEEMQALCPPGSENEVSLRMLTSYWDMVASFITADVLHKELFFQSGNELLYTWEKLRDFVPELRRLTGSTRVLANVEAVAHEFIDFHERHSAGSYAKFSAGVRAGRQKPADEAGS